MWTAARPEMRTGVRIATRRTAATMVRQRAAAVVAQKRTMAQAAARVATRTVVMGENDASPGWLDSHAELAR
jgi:hypothetical protein